MKHLHTYILDLSFDFEKFEEEMIDSGFSVSDFLMSETKDNKFITIDRTMDDPDGLMIEIMMDCGFNPEF